MLLRRSSSIAGTRSLAGFQQAIRSNRQNFKEFGPAGPLWEQDVGGSNPLAPTNFSPNNPALIGHSLSASAFVCIRDAGWRGSRWLDVGGDKQVLSRVWILRELSNARIDGVRTTTLLTSVIAAHITSVGLDDAK